MNEQRDLSQELAEIRLMMERSSKFMSLSGLAGVMAGIYALIGTWVAYSILNVTPGQLMDSAGLMNRTEFILLGLSVLILSVGTAILFSYRKASNRGETVWNATSKRMLANMFVPLSACGILILIALMKDILILIFPMTLIFYGLALYNASNFSYADVKYLGMAQIGLGLFAALYPEYSIILWAIGFGVIHILYGIYMHIRYER